MLKHPVSPKGVLLRVYKSFIMLGVESPISLNIRNFFRVVFFYFESSKSYFMKYKKNTRLESFISGNIKKGFEVGFFIFSSLGLKMPQGALFIATL